MSELHMSESRVVSRPALGSKAAVRSAGIAITALPEGHVIHVLGEAGGPDLAPLLREATGGKPHAVRAAGPAQWFLVSDERLSHAGITAVLDALPPGAAGIDQSHGRVRIRIDGPMTEHVLAKGTAVNLALAAFPVGQSTTTLIGHIAAHLTRIARDTFELMVLRTFAQSLWDDLATMSAEYVPSAADHAGG